MGKQHKISLDYVRLRARSISDIDDTENFLLTLVARLDTIIKEISKVVNRQMLKYYNQNGTPTTTQVPDGQTAIWKDADAGGGASTHYLVYNDNGSIITFASEETV